MLDFKPKEIAVLVGLFVLMLALYWFAAFSFAKAGMMLLEPR